VRSTGTFTRSNGVESMLHGTEIDIRNAKDSCLALPLAKRILASSTRLAALALLVFSVHPITSNADDTNAISRKANLQFLQTATAQWNHLAKKTARKIPTNLAVGESGFVGLTELIRGQSEISVDNVRFKLDERITLGDLKPLGSGNYALAHDGGRSSSPLNDPLEVVKTRHGYLITDGHHDFYLSLIAGAETVAVKVLEDFSHLSDRKLWKTLKARHLVYLNESVEALVRRRPSIDGVRDNPNRYLAGILAIKASTVRSADGSVVVTAVKGHSEGIWIKANGAVPFAEFHIASALSEAGIEYDARWKSAIPVEIVERARQALLKAQTNPKHQILKSILSIESARLARDLRADPVALAKAVDVFEAKIQPNCRAVFL
jgi:hypothetical protein